MAITQSFLFRWQDVESSPDIERARLVLDHLRDEELIARLEEERGHGRNDYPVPCVWNAYVCGLLFRHETTAALIAELKRNAELRALCGFDVLMGAEAVPTESAFSRFFANVSRHTDLLQKMFARLVGHLGELLPDLGVHLAVDGKAVPVVGKDAEADTGVKSYTDESGTESKTMSWNGYKIHMLCDAVHELPLAFKVTKASEHDGPHLLPLVEQLERDQPVIAARAEDAAADKGYDSAANKAELHDTHGIVPLIPSRNLAKDGMKPLDDQKHDTIYVSPSGELQCRVDPFATNPKAEFCKMQYQGFEPDRETLKYRCPAAAFGATCKNQQACQSATKDKDFGRVIRVALERDRRLHTPVPEDSDTFKDAYKRRTSIERLFSRLDNLYGLEKCRVHGLGKVTARITVALCAMAATAIGWIEEGRIEKRRCTLQSA